MDQEMSGCIGPTIIPIVYSELQDQDRLWISFSLSGYDSYRESLKMIEYLEQHNIPWVQQPQLERGNSVCIAIPILTAWVNPIPFQYAVKNIDQFFFGRFIIKDTKLFGGLIDWENFSESGSILRFGKWFLERSIDSVESIPLYIVDSKILDSAFATCFEEVFYLYHCGVFDSYSEDVKMKIREYISKGVLDVSERGRYFKILY